MSNGIATDTATLVKQLCDAEGNEVVLRFDDPLEVPTSKYDGHRYNTETASKATLRATIDRASVEDTGETLICFGLINEDEMKRVGIDPTVVQTEDVGDDEVACRFDIHGSRKWWLDEYDDVTREEAQKAIEEGREDDVLPPWDSPLSVTVTVARTDECLRKSYESDFYIQYDPPETEIGDIIDIRVLTS